jgi:hypothetical protein
MSLIRSPQEYLVHQIRGFWTVRAVLNAAFSISIAVKFISTIQKMMSKHGMDPSLPLNALGLPNSFLSFDITKATKILTESLLAAMRGSSVQLQFTSSSYYRLPAELPQVIMRVGPRSKVGVTDQDGFGNGLQATCMFHFMFINMPLSSSSVMQVHPLACGTRWQHNVAH